jgi:hypothetical protein
MRKRKFLIGAVAALAVSVAVAGIAMAGPVSQQTIGVTVVSGKQDKKIHGKIGSLDVNVDTTYTEPPPYTGKAVLTRVYFPKDWKFQTRGLNTCDKATLAGTTTEQARASVCGPAEVGNGESTVKSLITATGVVTAFNGVPSGGRPTILLHNRVGAPLNNTTVLEGILQPSDDPAYGTMLVVTVPILASGFVITHFGTTITPNPKLPAAGGKKASAAAKKKKKKTPPQFYIMARCGKSKKWVFDARSNYDTGVTTNSPDVTVPCKQKKAPKKKK